MSSTSVRLTFAAPPWPQHSGKKLADISTISNLLCSETWHTFLNTSRPQDYEMVLIKKFDRVPFEKFRRKSRKYNANFIDFFILN